MLAELRDLAHGIHPAVLSQSGLGAALDEVAGRLPLPVRVHRAAGAGSIPPWKRPLYFVACEALANVVKHAEADSARVTVRAGRSPGWNWRSPTTAPAAPGRPGDAPATGWPTWPTGSARSTARSSSTARPAWARG